ncbi:hypothetical protein HZF08_31555 [Paenibacillus sp. CGMCC 1.16610]|uniref:Uncharacterized protein n=1 Tax=Paenibacillus anseongense TaxID=2682845 RepID=A0ABW9UG26_9BACL|nr:MULTISPECIES: hypothetical protein [Paenibacillus]MBA2942811.1 hypothetical protein [Paenibacillus sp. CGMCC 1.16610]MVQ38296.1 hypothetical protein [Paenibacillus anseongense]
MSTNNQNDVVSHAINAAQANAEDSQAQQQVEELSSMLQSSTADANVDTSSEE